MPPRKAKAPESSDSSIIGSVESLGREAIRGARNLYDRYGDEARAALRTAAQATSPETIGPRLIRRAGRRLTRELSR